MHSACRYNLRRKLPVPLNHRLSNSDQIRYEFGPFVLDPQEQRLTRDGVSLSLAPKDFEILLALVRRAGRLVEKEELVKDVWPDDSFVEEANVSRRVYAVRRALGVTENGESYIETVPKRGYRFLPEVQEISVHAPANLVIEKRTQTRVVSREIIETEDLPPSRRDLLLLNAGRRKWRARNWLLLGLSLLLFAGAAYFWFLKRPKPPGTIRNVETLAIVPFTPLDAETKEKHLGLGMADALITSLGNLHQITVRPTSAVLKYADAPQDPEVVGKQLGVQAVLEGSVQQAENRVRVTARLVRVDDGATLWSQKFDTKLSDIFSVHDAISEQMADALTLQLSGEERQRLKKRHTDNAEAFQLYVIGRHHWNLRSRDDIKKAADYFEKAISADPEYALAYAALADTYDLFDEYDLLPPTQSFPKAIDAAEKALTIDESLAEPHASLAFAKTHYEWDWKGAEREFKRAIQLNPNYSTAHHWYAYFLVLESRSDEAFIEINRAHEIDPLSLIINTDIGEILFYARRYDEAINQFRKVLEMDPNFSPAHRRLWKVYEQKGMYNDALEMFLKFWAAWGNGMEARRELTTAYHQAGWTGVQRKWLEQRLNESKTSYVTPLSLAGIYARLGERDYAFDMLEKAYADHSSGIVYAKVEPVFDGLRDDQRFRNLMARVGLPY